MNLDTINEFADTTSTAGAVKTLMKNIGAVESRALMMVPFDQVQVIPGFNVRDDSEEYQQHLSNIESQMMQDGWRITEPAEVVILDGKVCMVDGHSRFIAASRAVAAGKDIPQIPAICHPQGTTMEELTVKLMTANSGAPLSTLGQAAVVGRLSRQFGKTQDEIATRLSMTKKYVSQLAKLDASPMELKRMISGGVVSASLVIVKLLEMTDGAAVLNFFKAHLEAQKPKDAEGGEGGETESKPKITAKGIRSAAEKVLAMQKKEASSLFKFVEDLTNSWDRMQKLIADNPDVAEGYNQLLTIEEFKAEADLMESAIDLITGVQARVEEVNKD